MMHDKTGSVILKVTHLSEPNRWDDGRQRLRATGPSVLQAVGNFIDPIAWERRCIPTRPNTLEAQPRNLR